MSQIGSILGHVTDLMSEVGSNLRLTQLHPLRHSHTDQSESSKLSFTEFPVVEVPQPVRLWDLKSKPWFLSTFNVCYLRSLTNNWMLYLLQSSGIVCWPSKASRQGEFNPKIINPWLSSRVLIVLIFEQSSPNLLSRLVFWMFLQESVKYTVPQSPCKFGTLYYDMNWTLYDKILHLYFLDFPKFS